MNDESQTDGQGCSFTSDDLMKGPFFKVLLFSFLPPPEYFLCSVSVCRCRLTMYALNHLRWSILRHNDAWGSLHICSNVFSIRKHWDKTFQSKGPPPRPLVFFLFSTSFVHIVCFFYASGDIECTPIHIAILFVDELSTKDFQRKQGLLLLDRLEMFNCTFAALHLILSNKENHIHMHRELIYLLFANIKQTKTK